MNRLSFSVVSPTKKSRFDFGISEKLTYLGLGGLITLLLFFKAYESSTGINLLEYQSFKYVCYGLIIILIIGIVYAFYDYNGNNRTIDGIITFDESEITLDNIKKFNLSEVSDLVFYLKDYKGRTINIIVDGTPYNSYGGDNFVEFNYRKEKFKYQFIIDSKFHGQLLEEKISKMEMLAEIKY